MWYLVAVWVLLAQYLCVQEYEFDALRRMYGNN